MSKTFEISNNYSYAKITWSETNDFATNSSIVSIDSLEIKTKSYYGVTYYLNGTIKVNGASVITFDSAKGTHLVTNSKAGTYYKVISADTALYSNAPWKTGAIAHNADGTKDITISVDITLRTINGGFASGQKLTGSTTEALTDLPKCAYLVSAPNFFDTDNPTITYNNVLGSAASAVYACISLTGAIDDIPYREIDKLGSSYTFELTDAERKTLLAATQGSNSRTVRFYVKTVNADGETFFKFLDKQFTVSAPLPIIEVSVVDSNVTTLSLTDNENIFIKDNSHASYTITATPQKEATIVSYSAVCGSEELTTASGEFMNVEYETITFTIVDSRGNRAQQTVELDMIPYYNPTISADAEIELSGETTAAVTITAIGQFFDYNFGVLANILSFQVRYKANSGDYTDWEEMGGSISFDESGYKATLVYDGLDYLKGYTFQVRAHDLLNITDSAETKLLKLIPVFDWSAADFNFNVPVSIQGNTLEDYVIATSTKSMGSNGTWYVEKWKSGKAVCYGCRNFANMAVSTAWGSLYISEKFTQSLPSSLFIDKPDYLNIAVRDGAGWIVKSNTTETSSSNTGAFFVCRGNAETLSQVYINFYAIGRWQ